MTRWIAAYIAAGLVFAGLDALWLAVLAVQMYQDSFGDMLLDTPNMTAAVIFYVFPILIVLAEPFVEKTRFGLMRLLIVLLAFAGVALVVGPRLDSLDPRGLALSLLAARAARRRPAKNVDSCRPHSWASTPLVTVAWWLRRSSENRSTTLPQAPVLGSRAPNTTRSMRACWIAPAHIAQGSSVTTSVQPGRR
jgi:hypothetical protein